MMKSFMATSDIIIKRSLLQTKATNTTSKLACLLTLSFVLSSSRQKISEILTQRV